MDQRLGNLLDDLLVELGGGAAKRELDFLVERPREVANRPRKRVEPRGDRQHRELDDVLPQLFGNQIQADAVVAEVDKELAHPPRQTVERVGVVRELCAAIHSGRVGGEARFPDAVAKTAEEALYPAQLGVPLER